MTKPTLSPRYKAYLRRYRMEPPLGCSPRRLNFYGHIVRKDDARRARVERAHAEAIRENTLWGRLKALVGA